MAPARATARVSIVPQSEDTVPGNLILITSIANQLLEATASMASQASEQVLAQLVEHFDLHHSFLRYSDHDIPGFVSARGIRAWSPDWAGTSSSSFRISRCRSMPQSHLPIGFGGWCVIV
jgi:hypothetical protein